MRPSFALVAPSVRRPERFPAVSAVTPSVGARTQRMSLAAFQSVITRAVLMA
jgi:hypothetical protein